MEWLEEAVRKQREYIEYILADPLSQMAGICARHWDDRVLLDRELAAFLRRKVGHRCRLLYAINSQGLQHSSSISDFIADTSIIGQDLSQRPYLRSISQNGDDSFSLSDVYVDKRTHKPCITALHRIEVNGAVQGYIAADFDLKDLPLKDVDSQQLHTWRQIKGDPSIRGTLFQQTRTQAAMDEQLSEVLDVVESLITEQGIFHVKLHFSSSRATLWPHNDPYRYRLHVLDEIIDPRVCLAYAKSSYPEMAVIPADRVAKILQMFKSLREADETIYLRAASLNVINGLVGLNFSCDGSHYMPAEEFLSKDVNFWFGGNEKQALCEAG